MKNKPIPKKLVPDTTIEQHLRVVDNYLEKIKGRYNPENDSGAVTWADATIIMALERITCCIDSLQIQIDNLKGGKA